jgi:hypothetical protein
MIAVREKAPREAGPKDRKRLYLRRIVPIEGPAAL